MKHVRFHVKAGVGAKTSLRRRNSGKIKGFFDFHISLCILCLFFVSSLSSDISDISSMNSKTIFLFVRL